MRMCDTKIGPINGGRVKFGFAATDFKNPAVGKINDPLYTVSKTFVPTPLIRAYFSRENMNRL